MSHHLDIEGIHEKLVLLEHFAFGSRSYCKKRMTGSSQDQGNQEFDEYWGWVKSIVSNYAIECSIKFRVLQDTIYGKDDIVKFEGLDSKSCHGLAIGKVTEGAFKLSLRESSNKIIHAKRVVPKWSESKTSNKKFKYWSGEVELCGERGAEQWRILLNIGLWAQAMQRFIVEFSHSDASHYVGQDWY